ncbi:MAG TPA: hypothetical protein VH228_02995 [Nocardioides sp.]|jgi:hypothetical protein|nr:hypothetical protein [Nocardioides sp.]
MHHLLAGLVTAAPVALGFAATPTAPAGHEVFAFDDPAIVEASALVTDDGLFLTTNDSGDTGRVFAVDRSGRTVGVTHWSDDPTDTEALAPGGPGYVWVGDIGDNTGERSSVEIARVPIGRMDRTVTPTTYRLTYPDGATDAETLLRDPTTGRLYIASKNVFGGVMYAVPEHLDPGRSNRMRAVGRVLPVATDGAFFPDGKHLVVRNYDTAVVYAWPSLQPVGQFDLPHQRQGEGIAVAPDGRLYVSSEGVHAPVLEVRLPPEIESAVKSQVSMAPASPSANGSSGSSPAEETDPASHDAWPWLAGGLLGLAAIVVLIRALRPH